MERGTTKLSRASLTKIGPNCERRLTTPATTSPSQKILCPDGNRFLPSLRFACKKRRKSTKPRKNKTPTSRQQQDCQVKPFNCFFDLRQRFGVKFYSSFFSPLSSLFSFFGDRRRTTQRLRFFCSPFSRLFCLGKGKRTVVLLFKGHGQTSCMDSRA